MRLNPGHGLWKAGKKLPRQRLVRYQLSIALQAMSAQAFLKHLLVKLRRQLRMFLNSVKSSATVAEENEDVTESTDLAAPFTPAADVDALVEQASLQGLIKRSALPGICSVDIHTHLHKQAYQLKLAIKTRIYQSRLKRFPESRRIYKPMFHHVPSNAQMSRFKRPVKRSRYIASAAMLQQEFKQSEIILSDNQLEHAGMQLCAHSEICTGIQHMLHLGFYPALDSGQ